MSVTIKAEYQQEFIEAQFTIDDFDWSNIERVDHHTYYPLARHMYVHLKRHGLIQVLIAVWHIKTLEFVQDAGFADQISAYF